MPAEKDKKGDPESYFFFSASFIRSKQHWNKKRGRESNMTMTKNERHFYNSGKTNRISKISVSI